MRQDKPEKVVESEERDERFISREKLSVFGDQIQFEELLKPSRRKESQDLFVLKTPFLYQDFRDTEGVSNTTDRTSITTNAFLR